MSGFKVYVQIPVGKRVLFSKLDTRAETGTLAGYGGSFIFRIYVLFQKIVICSSNAWFDKNGYVTSPPNDIFSGLRELEFSENGRDSENHKVFEIIG